jgi:hypothetical protein
MGGGRAVASFSAKARCLWRLCKKNRRTSEKIVQATNLFAGTPAALQGGQVCRQIGSCDKHSPVQFTPATRRGDRPARSADFSQENCNVRRNVILSAAKNLRAATQALGRQRDYSLRSE